MQQQIPKIFIQAAECAHAKPTVRITMKLGNLWQPGPGDEFLAALKRRLSEIAVQLGNSAFALRLCQRQEPGSILLSSAIANELVDGKLRIFDIDETLG